MILLFSQGAVGLDGPKGDQVCFISLPLHIMNMSERLESVELEHMKSQKPVMCLYPRDLQVLKEQQENKGTW